MSFVKAGFIVRDLKALNFEIQLTMKLEIPKILKLT